MIIRNNMNKETETKFNYVVSAWSNNTLNHYFGVFSSRALLLPLFERLLKVMPDALFNRIPNTNFNVKVHQVPVDQIIWYDSNSFETLFETANSSETVIRDFCGK